MNLLTSIQQRITLLPEKDIHYAKKFIAERDFQSLYEIVDSDIKKIKKSLQLENPKEEYLNLDLEGLEELRYDIDIYKKPLELEDIEDIYLEDDEYEES